MADAPAAPALDMSMLTSFIPLVIIFGLPKLGVDLNDPATILVFRCIALGYILLSFFLYKVVITGKINANKAALEKEVSLCHRIPDLT